MTACHICPSEAKVAPAAPIFVSGESEGLGWVRPYPAPPDQLSHPILSPNLSIISLIKVRPTPRSIFDFGEGPTKAI